MFESRRSFLHRAALIGAAAPLLKVLGGCTRQAPVGLVADPGGALDLPPGFTYRVLSRAGDLMSDGFFEPGAHDGMAAFPIAGDASRCVLVRNHEISAHSDEAGAFGAGHAKAAQVDPAFVYDRTPQGRPLLGGTTSLIVNVRERRAERSFLSLAGTDRNCAGGSTPWGSWLSCEETEETPGANATRMHGYVFEVPAGADSLVRPAPLEAMGRFRHEAVAVDPATGIAYLTEDDAEGLFYRFLPAVRGEFVRGGRLQALALGEARADTRNWSAEAQIPVGTRLEARWIDLKNVDAPDSDLRHRGRGDGAAIFARGEGMAAAIEAGKPVVYFACTSGGPAQRGQVWRLVPGAEGGDVLELFAESTGEAYFDMVDNIVVAPWGDLILCEDGDGDQYVRALAPTGAVYPIARNAHAEKSEFCGACFSPDGSTLFVNVQEPGVTYAIAGPWANLARAARVSVVRRS
jgi:secreted PhoX family phosphatase